MAMDELEISKIVGAGCAALLAFVGFGQLGSALVGVDQLDEPAYVIEVAEAEGVEVEEEEAMPIGQLMAMAVVDDGSNVFRKCSACHKLDDGANGVGPHLYNIVGRDIGGVDGYSYSATLAEMDGPWDFAALDGFLEAPKKWAPGTKMGFNGLSKPEDRASVIAWLNEQGSAPLPMPAVETAEAEAEPAETEMAAVEPQEEIAPGDVEASGEITEVDAGEGTGDVAVVNPEAPREAEVTQEQIADAATTEEPAEVEETAAVEAPVETEEPAQVETAEVAPAREAEAAPEAEVAEAPAESEVVVVEELKAEEPAAVAAVEPEAAPAPAAAAPAVVTAAAFMIGADAAEGAKVFRKCKACHKVDAGAGNGVGPNLHGVVGREIAAIGDFKYSDALSGKGGAWDFEALNGFLTKPKDWAPGTKMAFPGLRKDDDRANVIAYLNEQGDAPLPLPE